MYQVEVQWFGKQREKEISFRLNRGIAKATKFLYHRVREKINKWGSVFITSIKRRRYEHSFPGEPPRKQTGNLYNSLKWTLFTNNNGYLTGSVYSDVPYAEAVEKGGSVQIDQSQKTHTRVRLVNPIKRVITIAARPFMRPTLHENKERLAKIIARG